jgi:hypothetical protein
MRDCISFSSVHIFSRHTVSNPRLSYYLILPTPEPAKHQPFGPCWFASLPVSSVHWKAE